MPLFIRNTLTKARLQASTPCPADLRPSHLHGPLLTYTSLLAPDDFPDSNGDSHYRPLPVEGVLPAIPEEPEMADSHTTGSISLVALLPCTELCFLPLTPSFSNRSPKAKGLISFCHLILLWSILFP